MTKKLVRKQNKGRKQNKRTKKILRKKLVLFRGEGQSMQIPRVRDERIKGPNKFRWKNLKSDEVFVKEL